MIKSFKKRIGALVTVGPTVLWLGFFLMIPLIYVIGISFLTKKRLWRRGFYLYAFQLRGSVQ